MATPTARKKARSKTVAPLTHIDAKGRAQMVDVGAKDVTERIAVASATLVMKPATLQRINSGTIAKGEVFAVARVAGVMAAKRTHELIPLCHPLPINVASIEFEPVGRGRLEVRATVKVTGKTGVEMEALCAVTTAALTVYDMCKAIDRGMVITDVGLLEKSGGRSGEYKRSARPSPSPSPSPSPTASPSPRRKPGSKRARLDSGFRRNDVRAEE